MGEFRMPSLGADMEDGTLVEWLVKPGAAVKRGDIVAVVETQKGAIEIEIFEEGVVDKLLVEPGVTVPVGAPLAMIRGAGESPAPIPETPAATPKPPPATPPKLLAPAKAPPPLAPGGRVRASPAARRLAAERNIDLVSLRGTGADGAIQLADVEAASAPRGPERKAGVDLIQMRAAIAAAMSRSKREIPHYYLMHTADVGEAVDWTARVNAQRAPDARLLLGVLFLKATALAAKAFPEFNGRYEDGAFRQSPAVHLGAAIAIRGGGLVAPAIHDAADLDLDALMAGLRDLTARVRAGRFRSSEVADPTITVSSLGDRGVEALFGVIYPPQVAIVGFGKVVERPWAVDGMVSPRPVVTLTLAADHRVSDGHRGALFLADIARRLQAPEAL